jgi:Cdc6-like AAA superfamily ATPase
MGKVFYDMGILSSPEYVECSASDLIAPYVGQTGPKTVAVLKRGLGKVLFVDEAYRLGEGQFAKEAIDELVDSLTKPQFFGKLVVILAGYSENMNRLLQVNPGLSSRFPEEVVFQNMSANECYTLLQRQLKAAGIEFIPDNCQSKGHSDVIERFDQLSRLPSWGNGRDVKTLSKAIAGAAFASAESVSATLAVSTKEVITALENMYANQMARRKTEAKPAVEYSSRSRTMPPIFDLLTDSLSARPPAISTSSATKPAAPEPAPPNTDNNLDQQQRPGMAVCEEQRDPGVTEGTWAQLQADIMANELAERQAQNAIAKLEQHLETAQNEQEDSAKEARAVEEAARLRPVPDEGNDEEENERKRRHEEARLRALKARLAVREAEEKLRRIRAEEERKRKEEAVAQKKLRQMGVCPVGFRWIKQSTGYRCAGGSHFVSKEALEVQEL